MNMKKDKEWTFGEPQDDGPLDGAPVISLMMPQVGYFLVNTREDRGCTFGGSQKEGPLDFVILRFGIIVVQSSFQCIVGGANGPKKINCFG